ncbi:hypothetical protein, partial [Zooshikella harenae]
SNKFEAGVTFGNEPIYCTPKKNFMENIGDGQDNTIRFYLEGYTFSYPRDQRVEPDWTVSTSRIDFYMCSPFFKPVKGFSCSDRLSSFVHLYLGKTNQINDIEKLYVDGVYEKGRITKEILESRVQYYYSSLNGQRLFLIDCFDKDYLQCNHTFYNGEFTYSFSHMPKYVDQWKTLQDRLVDVIDRYID